MLKQKSLAMLLSVVTMVAVAVAGCSSSPAPSTSGSNPAPAKKVKIGLSMNTLNNPFFVTVKEGADAAAKAQGYDLIVTDAQNKPAKQLTDIENLIQQKPDVLILDPADSDSIVAAVEAANKANIPVFTIDRQANGGNRITHIGFDAIKSGNLAGQFLVDTLKGTGKIVEIQGIMGTSVAQDRSKGFNEIMAKNPNMKIVARLTANFDRAEAMKVMENILQANPEIDGVYAANDEMALGALAAIEAAGRTSKIKLIGCDAIDPSLEAIKSGKMAATIAEPPFFLGKKAIEIATDILAKKTLEKSVILPSNLVTKDNASTLKTRD